MTAGKAELFDFAATLVHQTAGALLLDVGAEKPVWFPKSVIEDNGDGTFTVPERVAVEKGLV